MNRFQQTAFLRFSCCAAAAMLACGSARGTPAFYGRLNVSLERSDLGAGSQTVLADNASRIGFIDTEQIAPGIVAGMQLEKSFDGADGTETASGFDRQAALFLAGQEFRLSIGRFGSTAYLFIPDMISMHNHDTGISAEALFAHVEPLSRKVGIAWSRAGLSAQVVRWLPDPAVQGKPGTAGVLAYDWRGLSLALSVAQQAGRTQRSVRALWVGSHVDVGAFLQKDSNVYGHGDRTAMRIAVAWRLSQADLHVNVGVASRYSGRAVGEEGATQSSVGYNYHLSSRTKLYILQTRLRDSGKLYGNRRAAALGMRHNF